LRSGTIYSVRPHGEKWAVVCDDEALVVTETETDAARIAQGALATLLSPRPPKPTPPGIAAERRTFAAPDDERRKAAFGFPVSGSDDEG